MTCHATRIMDCGNTNKTQCQHELSQLCGDCQEMSTAGHRIDSRHTSVAAAQHGMYIGADIGLWPKISSKIDYFRLRDVYAVGLMACPTADGRALISLRKNGEDSFSTPRFARLVFPQAVVTRLRRWSVSDPGLWTGLRTGAGRLFRGSRGQLLL